MEGILLVHASTGHILFSKAYTPGFGLQTPGAEDDAGAAAAGGGQRDPMVAAMLLANFLCALYQNVRELIEPDALDEPDEQTLEPTESDVDSAADVASDRRQRRLQQLMRDPLRSLDTGAEGPLLFFRRHEASNVFCALFLRRGLLDGRGSGATADPIGGDGDACTLALEGAGDWLAAALLRSFVRQFRTELSARPLRAGTKVFRPWLKAAEELYAAAFSRELVRRVTTALSAEWSPHWLYALYSDKFLAGMEQQQAERHQAAAQARGVQSERGRGARGSAAAVVPAAMAGAAAQQHRRRASGSVADAASIVAQPPAFVPRPPAHPSPASVAAAAAAAAAASSPSAGAAVLPVPSAPSFASSYPSTRPLAPRSGARFPFQAPVRRWWHFGRSKDAPELFFQNVGRTTCFYSGLADERMRSDADADADADADWWSEEDAAPAQIAPKAAPDSPPHPLSGAQLPSPEALRRLVALVHHAGMALSSPSEITDRIASMEVTLREPAAPAAAVAPPPAPSRAKVGQAPLSDAAIAVAPAPPTSTKLWVFRVHHLVLAFPTPAAAPIQPSSPPASHGLDASAVAEVAPADAFVPAVSVVAASGCSVPAPRHCTMPALLSSLRPLLHCLDVHYAFVAGIHERAERALQKSMEKMSKDKAAAK